MAFDSDPLVEIHLKEWPRLQTLFMKDWPRSAVIYGWIKNRLKWIKKEPNANIFHIFSPEGDINNGIVAFGKTGNITVYLTIYNPTNQLDKLKHALIKTKMIDWNDKADVCISAEITPWFLNIMEHLEHKMVEILVTRYFQLARQKAIAFDIECPPDVYIAPLKSDDMPGIDAQWPHRFDRSKDYLTDLVRLNGGQGIFSKADHSLRSWMLLFEFNDIAVVQTVKEHRRKGYSEVIMKSLAKQIALDGDDLLCFILIGNMPSENLVKKLGFEVAGYCNWIMYK